MPYFSFYCLYGLDHFIRADAVFRRVQLEDQQSFGIITCGSSNAVADLVKPVSDLEPT